MIKIPSNNTKLTTRYQDNDGYEGDTEIKSKYFNNITLENVCKIVNVKNQNTMFPRCEFHTRYTHTSTYPNDDLAHTGTYTRSEGARYTQGCKQRKKYKSDDNNVNVKFVPTPLTNAINKKNNSLSAHTGGFASPYILDKYSKNIKLDKYNFGNQYNLENLGTVLYNELLKYKVKLCNYIAKEFNDEFKQGIDLGSGETDQGVYCSNDYPCVLVRFSPKINDKNVTNSEKITFYKRYNYMLMSYFVAIVNYKSCECENGLGIEMVIRSSFGHNNPSIAVTDKSFRINIGLIPLKYADIIVESLVQLYNLFCLCEVDDSKHLIMDEELRNRLNCRRTVGFKEPTLPDTYWECLWAKGSPGNTGRNMIHELIERERDRPDLLATLVLDGIIKNPINFFKDLKLAELPLEKMFKLIEYNCSIKVITKKPTVKDFNSNDGIIFDNRLWTLVGTNKNNKAVKQKIVTKLFSKQYLKKINTRSELESFLEENVVFPVKHHISVNSKETLKNYKKFELNPNLSKHSTKINTDSAFLNIIKKICNALAVNLPDDLDYINLYKFLEKSYIEFICLKRTRTSDELNEITEWGSDSETEMKNFVNEKTIFGKKVIVANGMLAINLAYYAARAAISYIKAKRAYAGDDNDELLNKYRNNNDTLNVRVDCANTYFETWSGNPKNRYCLDNAMHPPKVHNDEKVDILFFDLNSFNADFIAQEVNLEEKLRLTKPNVVILDHTSSTTEFIGSHVLNIFQNHQDIQMVLLVTSSLKNEQGGSDNNPHGKVTIFSLGQNEQNNNLTDFIYKEITDLTKNGGLKKNSLLPKSAHAIRHSFKDRGFTTTTQLILNSALRIKDIKEFYKDEFNALYAMKLTEHEIFALYDDSIMKFRYVATVARFLTTYSKKNQNRLLFDRLSTIYGDDPDGFINTVNYKSNKYWLTFFNTKI